MLQNIVNYICRLFVYHVYRWGDEQNSKGIDEKDRPFLHPFLQAWGLALGEMLFLIVCLALETYKKYRRNRTPQHAMTDTSPLIKKPPKKETEPENNSSYKYSHLLYFFPAAILHIASRSFFFIALSLTTIASTQMTRGTNK